MCIFVTKEEQSFIRTVHSNSSSSFRIGISRGILSQERERERVIIYFGWTDSLCRLRLICCDWSEVEEITSCWIGNVCTKAVAIEGLVEVNSADTVTERNTPIDEPRVVDVFEDLCNVAAILRIHG